jgi:hypothetical protein
LKWMPIFLAVHLNTLTMLLKCIPFSNSGSRYKKMSGEKSLDKSKISCKGFSLLHLYNC